MEFSGFFKPYLANRALKDDERQHQLHQKQRLEVEEGDDLSVIRFNASYMEVVDKWFAWRGVLTSVAAMPLAFASAFVWTGVIEELFIGPTEGDWWFSIAIFVISLPLFALFAWFFKTDAFRFTHFPIRLNRKTRMVHVFRTNGTVLSAPWDDIFFCIASLPQRAWEIQGHVLDKDGTTVKETFALPVNGTGKHDRNQLPRYWEFVRRYMEDGPAAVARRVEYCLPIADHKESFTEGFHRLHGQAHALPSVLLVPILLLLYILPYPGRWIALRTSKLPVWPQEIEEACVIEPSDLYRKDASTNQPITDHAPIYFVAAVGVALLAAWVWWPM